MMIRSAEAWAYLAGLIDGDGSIYITIRKGRYYHVVLAFSNANQSLLHELEYLFGKGNWTWRSKNYVIGDIKWEGPAAKEIIEQIAPFLIGKRQQAELALMFPCPGKGAKGFTKKGINEYRAKQRMIYEMMHSLNRKWSKGKMRKRELPKAQL